MLHTDAERVRQARVDALSARALHERRLASLAWRIAVVDCLSVVVPALYFPVRYAAKGTPWQLQAEIVWEILAGVLAALALLKLSLRWSERATEHSKLRDANIDLVKQSTSLLRDPERVLTEVVDLFFEMAANLEAADREALKVYSERARQQAYRQALKEVNPESTATVCPQCKASPWVFQPGGCQLCGNTPKAGHRKER